MSPGDELPYEYALCEEPVLDCCDAGGSNARRGWTRKPGTYWTYVRISGGTRNAAVGSRSRSMDTSSVEEDGQVVGQRARDLERLQIEDVFARRFEELFEVGPLVEVDLLGDEPAGRVSQLEVRVAEVA